MRPILGGAKHLHPATTSPPIDVYEGVRSMATSRMTPRLFLAREIRRARETKGISRVELAQSVFVSESLVRAWESGRRIPHPDHLTRVEGILGTGGLFTRMREDLVQNEPLPEYMGRWREIEEGATSMLWYEPLLIPGLLQTEEYARAVFTNSGRQTGDVEEQVQVRLDRQKVLTPEHSLMFVAILDETLLYRPIGGAKTMHDQLVKVLERSEQPNVRIQIVSQEVGAYPGLAGGFAIAAMNGNEYAYVDDAFSGDVLEHPEDVATIKRIWETLRAEALPVKQSVALLAKAVERWAT